MAESHDIVSPAKRSRLAIRREPYWAHVQRNGYVGYRKTKDGGTWIARWREDAGKQRYRALELSHPTAAEAYDAAVKLARSWFDQMQEGTAGRATVRYAAAQYVESLRVRKGNDAARDAEGRIRKHIAPAFDRKLLDRIKTADIERWLHGLIPKEGSPERLRKAKDTANRNLTTLKALLNHAWRIGLVGTREPWSKIQPFSKVAKARDVFLSVAERRALLSHCNGGFKNLLGAAILTGARYGELRELEVRCFDRERKLLALEKGKTGPRDIPLSEVAIELFSACATGRAPDDYLLVRDDGRQWQHSDQDEAFKAAAKAAGIQPRAVFYTLRHSFIASALVGGVDIHTVAKITGTSIQMIQKNYGKMLHDDARSQLNKLSLL